jgi:lipopolysaccharide transport protein LptA
MKTLARHLLPLLACGPIALFVLFAPGLVHAERADREKPVNLEAARVTVDDIKRVHIFEGNVVLTQGTLTITEMGNSVPFTEKLDNLSKHKVTNIINKVLKYDATKAFDIAAHAQFNDTLLRVYETGGTAITLSTTGTVGGTSSNALKKAHVKLIVDAMKERNIPAYVADDYYCISWPSVYRSFKDELESIHQYTSEGFRMLANGEIGRFENCRFVEQTNIAKAGTTNTDWAFFFGNDTVAEAICVPEEMRGKIPTDYGRSKGIAWY